MKHSLFAIRSIGAEYANRLYLIVAALSVLLSVLVMGFAIWLTTFSGWWWLLVGALIIPVSVVIGLLVVVKILIRSLRPQQTHQQKLQTKEFVDKLERLSETAQTPKFILLFKIVRDIAAPRENGFIASISTDSTSLKHDFTVLARTFK